MGNMDDMRDGEISRLEAAIAAMQDDLARLRSAGQPKVLGAGHAWRLVAEYASRKLAEASFGDILGAHGGTMLQSEFGWLENAHDGCLRLLERAADGGFAASQVPAQGTSAAQAGRLLKQAHDLLARRRGQRLPPAWQDWDHRALAWLAAREVEES